MKNLILSECAQGKFSKKKKIIPSSAIQQKQPTPLMHNYYLLVITSLGTQITCLCGEDNDDGDNDNDNNNNNNNKLIIIIIIIN